MASLTRRLCRSALLRKPFAFITPASRFISYIVPPTAEETTAIDMIKYAKSLKHEESPYSEAVRILQQGLSVFSVAENPSAHIASGRLELNLATLHANMSNYEAAADCLKELLNSNLAPLIIKGAALQALTGLCLHLHQDKEAKDYAADFSTLWEEEGALSLASDKSQDVKFEAVALRRLAEMPFLNEPCDEGGISSSHLKDVSGAALLALAQFYHVQGTFSVSKDLYDKAIVTSKKELENSAFSLSAISMIPEAVHVGAMAGLGQLLTATGSFEEAEQHLTQALKEIEKTKGEKHPQVGSILACIGDLYEQRGVSQGSSEMLITEGIYKSALDLMKAPPLDNAKEQGVHLTELVALTRARLGAVLVPAPHRRSEVHKLQDWVDTTWRSSRPLPELLKLKSLLAGESKEQAMTESRGKGSVIDIRLDRVFFR